MRLTPDEFQTIYSVFIAIVLAFMAFVGAMILRFEYRRRHPQPPPRRPPVPPGTGEYRGAAATFGISGMGASDMTSSDMSSTTPSSSDSGGSESSDSGSSDSGGGSDFSGGGGDSGGGGSSGSWAILLAVSLACAAPAYASAGPKLAAAAAKQVGVTVLYDPAYVRLRYPGGDVPLDRGVCTDVVIRAFRTIGVDLQREVHEDMRANFRAYPKMWGLSGPDTNIDHRRVPNLMKFFERRGKTARGAFAPGDIVAWRLPGGLYHIGIVADAPFVVHNIGRGAQREDILHAYPIIGHYRW